MISNNTSARLILPAVIFKTKNQMDDYNAADMKWGDLTEEQLKQHYGLNNVGVFCKKYSGWDFIAQAHTPNMKITEWCTPYTMPDKKESAQILFDRFRDLSDMFSFWGDYKLLIRKLIDHMQGNTGRVFTHPWLDQAMYQQIVQDQSDNNSLLRIKHVLAKYINWDNKHYPSVRQSEFYDLLMRGNLPIFNDFKHYTNGLVISVHGTWATHITLQSLEINGDTFKAKVHYRIQDHFGLDDKDILHPMYKNANIFRIWFLLQRWKEYGYRPFITEMNATVTIEGKRGEKYVKE